MDFGASLQPITLVFFSVKHYWNTVCSNLLKLANKNHKREGFIVLVNEDTKGMNLWLMRSSELLGPTMAPAFPKCGHCFSSRTGTQLLPASIREMASAFPLTSTWWCQHDKAVFPQAFCWGPLTAKRPCIELRAVKLPRTASQAAGPGSEPVNAGKRLQERFF